MALPSNFLVSWWYTPNTKLGVYFNNFGLQAATTQLTAIGNQGVDYSNGMGASIEENYHFENLITNHPVENTTAITDHIIPQPTVITITGIVTSVKTIAFGLTSTIDFSQLGSAIQLLISLAQRNTGISLLSGLLYGSRYVRIDNLAIQSLDIPRNNSYGRSSVKFTMVLKQLIITSTNGTVSASSFSQAEESDGSVDIP